MAGVKPEQWQQLEPRGLSTSGTKFLTLPAGVMATPNSDLTQSQCALCVLGSRGTAAAAVGGGRNSAASVWLSPDHCSGTACSPSFVRGNSTSRLIHTRHGAQSCIQLYPAFPAGVGWICLCVRPLPAVLSVNKDACVPCAHPSSNRGACWTSCCC